MRAQSDLAFTLSMTLPAVFFPPGCNKAIETGCPEVGSFKSAGFLVAGSWFCRPGWETKAEAFVYFTRGRKSALVLTLVVVRILVFHSCGFSLRTVSSP